MNCSQYDHVTEAYLSGEIDGPEWRSHLNECPECAGKLRGESNFDLIIRQAVSAERLQTRQLEAHVRAAIRRSAASWYRPILVRIPYAVAAMVAFATLVIATIAYAEGRIDRTAICVDAADDHQEEIVGKAPRKWRSDAKDVEALSQKVTGDPSVPARIVPAGYHLVGARICVLHGKKYMHLDYSDGSSDISLFVRHQDEAKTVATRLLNWFESTAPKTERVDNFAVGSVQKHSLSLVLVSSSSVTDLQRIVDQVGDRL
ncbi:MAG TPA: hypothetical protein VM912_03060 [Terriglobales bacterium]|nr:hypothetical protein [Terriglobales bacterium]